MTPPRLVCVGASAGGLAPLLEIVGALPGDFPASVLVVVHMLAEAPSELPRILDRAGPLPAAPAVDGEEIRPGTIHVAVPDHHLMVEGGRVRVVRGPKENRHRPAIDTLFRSAAVHHGPRVTGVVLSGSLDDGTAGLIAIKIRGGIAIVQDPADAFSAEMPRNAMRYLEVDHVAPAGEIAKILDRMTRRPAPETEPPVPVEMADEARIGEFDLEEIENEARPGTNSPFACPDCHGVLWEIQEGRLVRYRCRVGHAYSPETLLGAGDEAIEDALWEALRALEERVALRKRLASQARDRNLSSLADHFEKQVPDAVRHAQALRDMLISGSRSDPQ